MPEIRKNYQFWFYEYPSGEPFWVSAAQLRQRPAQVREVLDPRHSEPALDQMVLVGHSMGGLLAKLQTVDSGDAFWRTVSDYPLDRAQGPAGRSPAIGARVLFPPNPSIRRVITIATPHRGSKFANSTAQWLAARLITMPEQIVKGRQDLYRENPGKLRDPSPVEVTTSIQSLAPDDPIFPVMLAAPRPPWVKYHNIVGRGAQPRHRRQDGRRDATGSSRLTAPIATQVESDLKVEADHLTVHRHPLSVLEVQRILLLHLDELRSFPHAPPPRSANRHRHSAYPVASGHAVCAPRRVVRSITRLRCRPGRLPPWETADLSSPAPARKTPLTTKVAIPFVIRRHDVPRRMLGIAMREWRQRTPSGIRPTTCARRDRPA